MTTEELPERYKPGIPRISSIVEALHPFEGEDKRRFIMWLKAKNISLEEYMKEASEGGTAIHNALDGWIRKEARTIQPRWARFAASGMSFLKEWKVKPLTTEEFVLTDSYQGTIDLTAKIGNKTYVLDWKTYGLAKHAFGLYDENRAYIKPYAKLKKATIQLSLYAHAKGIKNIAVIELLIDGYKFHELKRMSKKDITATLKKFKELNK